MPYSSCHFWVLKLFRDPQVSRSAPRVSSGLLLCGLPRTGGEKERAGCSLKQIQEERSEIRQSRDDTWGEGVLSEPCSPWCRFAQEIPPVPCGSRSSSRYRRETARFRRREPHPQTQRRWQARRRTALPVGGCAAGAGPAACAALQAPPTIAAAAEKSRCTPSALALHDAPPDASLCGADRRASVRETHRRLSRPFVHCRDEGLGGERGLGCRGRLCPSRRQRDCGSEAGGKPRGPSAGPHSANAPRAARPRSSPRGRAPASAGWPGCSGYSVVFPSPHAAPLRAPRRCASPPWHRRRRRRGAGPCLRAVAPQNRRPPPNQQMRCPTNLAAARGKRQGCSGKLKEEV